MIQVKEGIREGMEKDSNDTNFREKMMGKSKWMSVPKNFRRDEERQNSCEYYEKGTEWEAKEGRATT